MKKAAVTRPFLLVHMRLVDGGKLYRTRFLRVGRIGIGSSLAAVPARSDLEVASVPGLPLTVAADFGSAAIAGLDRAMLLNNNRCCMRMAFSVDDRVTVVRIRNSHAMRVFDFPTFVQSGEDTAAYREVFMRKDHSPTTAYWPLGGGMAKNPGKTCCR